MESGVVTERNWERMKEQIWADSCAIRKIDINFAAPNAVARHPYITPRTLRKILRKRQLKGGWSTIEDTVEDNTLTNEEAGRLAPYLHFGTVPLGGTVRAGGSGTEADAEGVRSDMQPNFNNQK